MKSVLILSLLAEQAFITSSNLEIAAEEQWSPSELPLNGGKLSVKRIKSVKKKTKRKKHPKKIIATTTPSMLQTIPPSQEIVEPKKPRTVNGRKSYMQHLLEKNARYQQTTTTPDPLIYDTINNITYRQEDLRVMCDQTKRTAANFGIKDVSTFAEGNCSLIRITYPDVTCEQISLFMKYCKSIESI